MSFKLHRQAEALMADAELLMSEGRNDEAKSCWLAAARLEAEAFTEIPRDRGKTRGIIAVSAVALFRDAGEVEKALYLADEYLTTGDLPDAWQAELAALVHTTVRQSASEKARLRAARESGARDELMALLGEYSGAHSTQEVLDTFLVDLTIDCGALPPLDWVIEAIRLANSIEVPKVGSAVRQVVGRRRQHPTSAAATATPDSLSGAARRSAPNHDAQTTPPSSSKIDTPTLT